ncbi:MAG: hypothetical protein HUJ42_00690 [Malacoplasma sp.]|nr:hypothetical protein [Malacoplasma sp.]
MEYKEIKKVYEKQVDTISKLLKSNEFTNLLKNDETLQSNFVDQISLISFFEKKLIDTKLIEKEVKEAKKKKAKPSLIEVKDLNKAESILKEYHKLGCAGSIEELKNINSITDAKDTIKSFDVFLKNIYKKDSNEFINSKSDSSQNEGEATTSRQTFKAEQTSQEDSNQSNSGNFNNGFNPNMGQNPFGAGFNPFSGFNDETSYQAWRENQMATAAYVELGNQIKNGTFYIYKDKPRIFVILKRILGAFMIFLSLFTIISFISLIIVSTSKSGDTTIFTGMLWYDVSGTVQGISTSTMGWITIILTVFLVIYSALSGYRFIVGGKTENELFSFDKRAAIGIIALMVFLSIFTIQNLVLWFPKMDAINSFTSGTASVTDVNGNTTNSNVQNSATAIGAFNVCIWTTLISEILFLLVAIFLIALWRISPRIDDERKKLKLQEIIEEIRKNSNFSQQQ